MKTTTFPPKHSVNHSSCTLALLLIPLALACFALSPQARAVCQEGCTTDTGNTFLGDNAFVSNTLGFNNTAIGAQALFSNTAGENNTGIGTNTLYYNVTGNNNTAVGYSALENNSTGTSNTAVGMFALGSTSGSSNTAVGLSSLGHNSTGNDNTAIGFDALLSNTTGSNNIAVGPSAGQNLTTGSNNIDIGNAGVVGESSQIRIGTQGRHTATFMAGIRDTPVVGGISVGVTSSGQLGVAPSSQRFKEAIKPMDKTSEGILALKPVTFRYKHELDPEGIPQFGLVAEEVEKVNPDLVARDEQGKAYTVRYEAVNAMLLNEFLKEHRSVQKLKSIVAKQEATAAHQQKQIEALTAGLQKVSAQLEANKTAPQVVLNKQ